MLIKLYEQIIYLKKERDYIVKDGSLKIIDELTGRILEGRRFGDGFIKH